MNNEDAQAILSLIVLIALLAIIFIPIALFIGYTVLQKRKRDRTRETIIRDHQQLIASHRWVPVRYASERRFKELFKIFPWEGAGILVIVPGSALFLGHTLDGSSEMLQFAPGNSTLNWLGKSPWPNGAVSWFYFTTTTEKHYFTSETGVAVFGSHKSTRAIYDEVGKGFLAHSAS
jgi:hypothetical protein